MDLKTFLENFETIAQAPNGIPKLRSLILDLAVRGKLVSQSSAEGNASELLRQIDTQKKKLIEDRKIRSSKSSGSIQSDNILYALPEGWEWVWLDDISDIGTGSTPLTSNPAYYEGGVIPWITSTSTSQDFISKTDSYITDLAVKDYRLRIYKPGTLIIALYGQGKTRGQTSKLEFSAAINQACAAIALIEDAEEHREYIRYFFKKNYEKLRALAAGGAQPNLNVGKIKTTLVPLPPLAEQKRIVKKVDELMGLCDRLSSTQQARDNLRQKLRKSEIASLMNAETDEELEKAWAIVRDSWHDLSQDPKDVDDLRRSVLQLAARGKLVSQDAEDETAEQLLQKAIQEKALMAQAGLIPKPRQSSPINEDEYPFSLPLSWKWVRLEDICTYIVDCLHRTPKYQDKGYPAIRTSEMQPGRILFDQARRVGREEYEMQTQRLVPKAGDIFYSREGSFGIAAVVPEEIEMCLSQRMMQFRAVSEVNPHFFSWVMNSSAIYKQAARDIVGMTVPHINIRSLKEFVFPLAPYAEQKRIAAKVDELMQMCDRLEESLCQSQQQAEALAASAINHLTI